MLSRHENTVCHVQAWCEAGVGAMPIDTDTDTDVGDWLAETSESQSHAVPTPMRQVSFIGLDTVQEASSEGTPTSAPTQHGAVSPVHLRTSDRMFHFRTSHRWTCQALGFAQVFIQQRKLPYHSCGLCNVAYCVLNVLYGLLLCRRAAMEQ